MFRGQRHYSGWYWSSTMGHHVVYESRLELARLLLADMDSTVDGVVGQPMLLAGRDGKQFRRHVPDYLLLSRDGSARLVDVKPSDRLADPKVVAQFRWTRELCRAKGWGFEVWSGCDPLVMANVRLLAGFRRADFVDPDAAAMVTAGVGTGARIEELEAAGSASSAPEAIRAAVLHLLWRGLLTADLKVALNRSTFVRPIPGSDLAAAHEGTQVNG